MKKKGKSITGWLWGGGGHMTHALKKQKRWKSRNGQGALSGQQFAAILGGSPYWRSPSRSYLVFWSIRSSNQSDLSCLSFPNFLLSILIFNIPFNSLFIIFHSPFMYFRLSELGVV